ncbi:MAG: hypothetical protein IJ068_01755 [Bacilli bacterium]|nr:hypothetical protein [Bacilli bacterium]
MNFDDYSEKLIKSTLDNVNEFLTSVTKSKTFKASIYLVKYVENKKTKYWINFFQIFEKLNYEEQIQVLVNASNILKNIKSKEDNQEQSKMKVKDYYG